MALNRFLAAASLGILVLVPAAHAAAVTWLLQSPAASPSPRASMACAYDPISQKVVIFGGYHSTSYLQETWTYDGSTWTLESPRVSPPARAGSSMAYDDVTHQLILFGGYNGTYLGDTWLWDGSTSQWTNANPPNAPQAVTGPMLFTDPLNGHVDVYGGFKPPFYKLTTHQWNGTKWQQLQPSTSPYARAAGIVGLDSVHHQVVLFGGLGSVNPDNTWTWDGVNWTQQNPSQQPPLRYYSSAAFEPHLGNVVVFGGGSGGTDIADTWGWTGTDWQMLNPERSPAARESFALAYDDALGKLVLFGGENPAASQFSDTWWFEVEPLSCPADITGDKAVNVDDLLAVINHWGACVSPPTGCAGDIVPSGGDGQVNVDDLLAIINGWGPCP